MRLNFKVDFVKKILVNTVNSTQNPLKKLDVAEKSFQLYPKTKSRWCGKRGLGEPQFSLVRISIVT